MLEKLAETKPAKTDEAFAGVLSEAEELGLEDHLRQHSTADLNNCLEYTDVYVDDFILLKQGTLSMRKTRYEISSTTSTECFAPTTPAT